MCRAITIFWNSAVQPVEGGFHLAPEDLRWLEADFAATDLPTIIFSHLPLDNWSMIGNFYFEKAVPRGAHYAEGAAARDGAHSLFPARLPAQQEVK